LPYYSRDYPYLTDLTELEPNQEYKIWVVAKTRSANYSKSEVLMVTTMEQVNRPEAVQTNPRNMTVSWKSPAFNHMKTHQMEYFPRLKIPSQRAQVHLF
jgi:hypothetical protein